MFTSRVGALVVIAALIETSAAITPLSRSAFNGCAGIDARIVGTCLIVTAVGVYVTFGITTAEITGLVVVAIDPLAIDGCTVLLVETSLIAAAIIIVVALVVTGAPITGFASLTVDRGAGAGRTDPVLAILALTIAIILTATVESAWIAIRSPAIHIGFPTVLYPVVATVLASIARISCIGRPIWSRIRRRVRCCMIRFMIPDISSGVILLLLRNFDLRGGTTHGRDKNENQHQTEITDYALGARTHDNNPQNRGDVHSLRII